MTALPQRSTSERGSSGLDCQERSIISTLLNEFPSEPLPDILTKLLRHAPESFDDSRCGVIAVAIRELNLTGKPVHLLTVREWLDTHSSLDDAGGAMFLGALAVDCVTLDIAGFEAGSVWTAYQTRRTRQLLGEALTEIDRQPDMAGTIANLAAKALAELGSNGQADSLPPILDAAEFLTEKIILPHELIYGVLHQGSKMVLGGGSKTFKTWTLLDLGVAVATGEPWLSFKTAKGRVLFLNFEIQSGFFQQRLHAVAKEKGVTLTKGQIDVWNLRGHATGYNLLLPRIIERVKESGYALIVLDPIYKLYGQTDENSAGEVAQLLNAIEMLTVISRAAVAFGAHYSKGNQAGKEAIDRISGSGVFARDPDSILNFTRHKEKDAFTVESTLRNFKPVEPFVVRWQYPLMRLAPDLDPTALKKPGPEKEHDLLKLLACIKNTTSDKPISISLWATVADVPRETLREYLGPMRQKGWIGTVGNGTKARKFITDIGLKALSKPLGEVVVK